MPNGRKAFITLALVLSLAMNGCTLFPNNNNPNQPGPVRYKTTRKVIPTIPIRPTKIGKAVKVIPTKVGKAVKVIPTKVGRAVKVLPTKVKVLPTKIGGTVKKNLNKIKLIPTPKVMRSTQGGTR